MNDQTNNVILKKVDNSTFESFEGFVFESLKHFNRENVPNEKIIIYMPHYFNRMLSDHWSMSPYNKQRMDYMEQFRGVKITNGYENKVVVAFEDGLLYNIEHREMPI